MQQEEGSVNPVRSGDEAEQGAPVAGAPDGAVRPAAAHRDAGGLQGHLTPDRRTAEALRTDELNEAGRALLENWPSINVDGNSARHAAILEVQREAAAAERERILAVIPTRGGGWIRRRIRDLPPASVPDHD